MNSGTKEKRRWAVVEFETAAEHEDLASWLMMQCGSNGCEIKPSNNGEVTVHAPFNDAELTEEQLANIKCRMEEYGLSPALKSLRHTSIVEEDWLAKWKEGFEPFNVGAKLIVCPPWSLDDLKKADTGDRTILVLEPGMAFGTGLHATTQYCLRALEAQTPPLSVIDVGTGSGILAIACAMLYPTSAVTGVDTDPVAIEVAHKNLELNDMQGKIKLICGSTESVADQKFDAILSNLTCEDIVSILPEYEEILAPNGYVICAGILQEKLPMLQSALEDRGWKELDLQLSGMWAGLTIARR